MGPTQYSFFAAHLTIKIKRILTMKFLICLFLGVLTGTHVNAQTCSLPAPTSPSTNLNFTSVSSLSVMLNLSPGSGTHRIITMKKNSPVNVALANCLSSGIPTDNIFQIGEGTDLGGGTILLGASSSSNIHLYGFLPGTTYYFAVYEAVNSGPTFSINNSQVLTGSITTQTCTPLEPTVSSRDISISWPQAGTLSISWTKGNGDKQLVFIRPSTQSAYFPSDGTPLFTDFELPTTISYPNAPVYSGNSLLYAGTANNITVTDANFGMTYIVTILEANSCGYDYLVSSYTSFPILLCPPTPTQNPSGLTVSQISNTDLQLNWANGNGNGRIVVAKKNSPVDYVPSECLSVDVSRTFRFGDFALGNGNYLVRINMAGFSSSTVVTNLEPGATYHFAVFEGNYSESIPWLKCPCYESST
jgi:hypothetical protein